MTLGRGGNRDVQNFPSFGRGFDPHRPYQTNPVSFQGVPGAHIFCVSSLYQARATDRAQKECVMRSEHTGIFDRTIIETPDEWFSGGGGLLGSVNSAIAVAQCAKRAREAFRKVFNLPEDTSTKNVIVLLDSSTRRPLTCDENQNVLEKIENLKDRDLRNNPVLYDVRALLFAAKVFHPTWQKREALLRRQHEFEFRIVELLRELSFLNEKLQSLAMQIAALDIRIAVAPYEKTAGGPARARSKLEKKKAAVKTLWMGRLRRLIRQHPKWTKYAIAMEAKKNPPKSLTGGGRSTLERYFDEIVNSRPPKP